MRLELDLELVCVREGQGLDQLREKPEGASRVATDTQVDQGEVRCRQGTDFPAGRGTEPVTRLKGGGLG